MWTANYDNCPCCPSVRQSVCRTRISPKLSKTELRLLLNSNRKYGFLIQNRPSATGSAVSTICRSEHKLDVPRTHRRTVGDRAFAAAGPTLWNSLPHDISDCVSLTSFCRKLKTFLFYISFPWLHVFYCIFPLFMLLSKLIFRWIKLIIIIFLFSGPWGFYLGHFKHFLCMYVQMSFYK